MSDTAEPVADTRRLARDDTADHHAVIREGEPGDIRRLTDRALRDAMRRISRSQCE